MFRVSTAVFAAALTTSALSLLTPVSAAETCVRIQHMKCLNVRLNAGGKVIGHLDLGDKVKTSSCAAWCKIARAKPAFFAAKCPPSANCKGKPTTKPATKCGAAVVRKGAC